MNDIMGVFLVFKRWQVGAQGVDGEGGISIVNLHGLKCEMNDIFQIARPKKLQISRLHGQQF